MGGGGSGILLSDSNGFIREALLSTEETAPTGS
jgi:hypothetical protein